MFLFTFGTCCNDHGRILHDAPIFYPWICEWLFDCRSWMPQRQFNNNSYPKTSIVPTVMMLKTSIDGSSCQLGIIMIKNQKWNWWRRRNSLWRKLVEKIRNVNRTPEIRKSVLFPWQPVFEFIYLSFSSRRLHKNYQMSDKINSHICLILSVYKSFHRTVKNGKETM